MKTQDVDGMHPMNVTHVVEGMMYEVGIEDGFWFHGSLDCYARIWKDHLEPKGWTWWRGGSEVSYADWGATNSIGGWETVKNTGDFLTDFSRLTLKALLAQKETEAQ